MRDRPSHASLKNASKERKRELYGECIQEPGVWGDFRCIWAVARFTDRRIRIICPTTEDLIILPDHESPLEVRSPFDDTIQLVYLGGWIFTTVVPSEATVDDNMKKLNSWQSKSLLCIGIECFSRRDSDEMATTKNGKEWWEHDVCG